MPNPYSPEGLAYTRSQHSEPVPERELPAGYTLDWECPWTDNDAIWLEVCLKVVDHFDDAPVSPP